MSRYEQEQKDKAYRIYVTDALRLIGENTAKYVGGGYLKVRWADIVDPKPQETRTGEQIVADVVKSAGLKVVSKDGSI